MATVIGVDKTIYKQFTCRNCASIVQYAPNEAQPKLTSRGQTCTEEGTIIKGLNCPSCGQFHRTNA